MTAMQTLLRFAAVLSFGCCFAGGLWLFGEGLSQYRDAFLLAAAGLIVMGMAIFIGAMLWLAAEKCGPRPDGK